MDTTILETLKTLESEEKVRNTLTNIWAKDTRNLKIGVRRHLSFIIFPAAILMLSVICLLLINSINNRTINFAEVMIDNMLEGMTVAVANINDVNKIRKIYDNYKISLCREVALNIKIDPSYLNNQNLKQLAKKSGVDEIHVINEEGFLIFSSISETPGMIGMNFYETMQTIPFTKILSGEITELAQEPRERGLDKKPFQYIGVNRLDKKGIVQIGYQHNESDYALEVFTIEEVVKNSRIDFDGGVLIIYENGNIVAASESEFNGKSIENTLFKNLVRKTPKTPFNFSRNNSKMFGKIVKYNDITILGYINLDSMEKQSLQSISQIVVLMAVMITIMIAILLYFVVKLTINPIEKLQKDIRNLEPGKYLYLQKFSTNREISVLALEVNKMLLRISESEKSLSKIKDIRIMLQDLLFAESISLRISNAFVEFSDFDDYIEKLISIISGFLSGFSKTYIIRIGFFDKDKSRMNFKYMYNSFPEIVENSNETALLKIINNAEFPDEISSSVTPVIYCENTENEQNYKFMTEYGVKSFAISPIYINRKYQAVLCFEIFDEYAVWTELYRKTIITACSGIAYAVMRKEAETAKEKALVEAEISSKMKSEFLSTISHEIRTPINAIVGLTEIHLQHQNLPSFITQDAEIILKNGIALLDIVNRIFDFSNLQQNKLEITPREYYIRPMLKEVCDINKTNIKNKHLDFIFYIDKKLPKLLFGDDERIKQVLDNLLSNAVKFTESGSVTLTIKEIERINSSVYIYFSVKDTGIGIDEESQKNMLKGFSQIDSSYSRKYSGIGIGFSIAREFVNLMGGNIEISSKVGKGSEFSFIIKQKIIDIQPIGKLENKDIFTNTEESIESIKNEFKISYMPYGKVLIVDDVKTNLDVAKGLMTPYGLEIDCVSSGKDAIKMIEKQQKNYDCVFMDHMMPDMDGIEATKYIRKKIDSDYARNLPIVALTANITISKKIFYENGFDDYITKPIDKLDLDNILMKHIYDEKKNNDFTETKTSGQPVKKVEDDFSSERLKSVKINGLDITTALNNFSGNTEIYINVLTSFVNNVIPLVQKIEYVKHETLPEYAILVHGLKGSCYGIGANECGDLAKELEIAAKKGDFEQVSYKTKFFIQSINELVIRIDNFLTEIKNNKENTDKRKEKDKPSDELLKELLEAVSIYDLNKINDIIAELDKYRYKKDGDLIAFLKECAINFAYDKLEKKLIAELFR